MEAKTKAKELLEKMNVLHYQKIGKGIGRGLPVSMHSTQIKQCALIAVEQIIDQLTIIENDFFESHEYPQGFQIASKVKFWQEVKQEIENL